MRPGVRIALDIGARRIGVARCDRDCIMAVPVDTVAADSPDWLLRVQSIVAEYEPVEIIIGNPVSLRGNEELAATTVRARAIELATAMPDVPIRLVDERLTTAAAAKQLQAAGRSTRTARNVIDVQAAIGILEFALEYERRTGEPAGDAL